MQECARTTIIDGDKRGCRSLTASLNRPSLLVLHRRSWNLDPGMSSFGRPPAWSYHIDRFPSIHTPRKEVQWLNQKEKTGLSRYDSSFRSVWSILRLADPVQSILDRQSREQRTGNEVAQTGVLEAVMKQKWINQVVTISSYVVSFSALYSAQQA